MTTVTAAAVILSRESENEDVFGTLGSSIVPIQYSGRLGPESDWAGQPLLFQPSRPDLSGPHSHLRGPGRPLHTSRLCLGLAKLLWRARLVRFRHRQRVSKAISRHSTAVDLPNR